MNSFNSMRKIECFKIRILQGDISHKWEICHLKPIYDLLCDHMPFSLNPITIIADPFLFVYNDRLYLFYEKKRNYSPGVICMISTDDLVHWSKPITVLEEGFHLSYPFVFEDAGRIFLIPESSEVGDIRLYMADNDQLSHFSFYKTLVSKEVVDTEIGYADSSVYKKDGVYYLITSIEKGKNSRNNNLYLFFSDKLCGPYMEHPDSPICSSPKYGRNGGAFLVDDGKIYRVAQDCELSYGDNIHLLQVAKITKELYEEIVVSLNLLPQDVQFYRYGGHQYNYVIFRNRVVVATDAKEYNSYSLYRLLHKVGLLLCQFFKKFLP